MLNNFQNKLLLYLYGQKYKFCEKSNKIDLVALELALYPHSDSDTLTERHFVTNFFWGYWELQNR